MVSSTLSYYKPKECLRVIQNLFSTPKYSELKISKRAWIKLMCFCYLAGKNEITGFGRIKDGVIIDFKIPYQEVSTTTAVASSEEIMDFMRTIPVEEIPEWELDWHSHVDMQAFISGTDETNYEAMSMAKGGKQFPLMVVNKAGNYILKNFICEGKIPDIKLSMLETSVTDDEVNKIYYECYDEVKTKLREKIIKYDRNYWGGHSYNQGKIFNSKSSKNVNYVSDVNTAEDVEDNEIRCSSCGVALVSADEIAVGLCDDCYNAWYQSDYR